MSYNASFDNMCYKNGSFIVKHSVLDRLYDMGLATKKEVGIQLDYNSNIIPSSFIIGDEDEIHMGDIHENTFIVCHTHTPTEKTGNHYMPPSGPDYMSNITSQFNSNCVIFDIIISPHGYFLIRATDKLKEFGEFIEECNKDDFEPESPLYIESPDDWLSYNDSEINGRLTFNMCHRDNDLKRYLFEINNRGFEVKFYPKGCDICYPTNCVTFNKSKTLD
jgi:hypothetical protein